MKTMKSLFSLLFLVALSISSFGQVITPTQQSPYNYPPNTWPSNNSWLMLAAPYADFISLNNAAAGLATNNTFTGTNVFTGTTTINGAVTSKANIISDSALSKVTLTASQSGSTVLLKALAGDTIALPAATLANLGVNFTIILAYSTTSIGHAIYTSGTDVFYGMTYVANGDSAKSFASTSNKTMLMTPTTTGGLAGGKVEVNCIGYGRWSTTGLLRGSGAPATPFKN